MENITLKAGTDSDVTDTTIRGEWIDSDQKILTREDRAGVWRVVIDGQGSEALVPLANYEIGFDAESGDYYVWGGYGEFIKSPVEWSTAERGIEVGHYPTLAQARAAHPNAGVSAEALDASEYRDAAATLGSRTSPRKARAARRNGKLGGRPRKAK